MSQFACKEFSALDKELKDDLLECYQEAQQEIEEVINDIEDNGFSFDKLDNLFRSLHSMKGNCSVCFLDPLVDALHRLEEIVDGMRGGYIKYDYHLGALINVVIERVYALLLDLYKYHGADTAQIQLIQSHLDSIYAEEDDSQRPEMAEAFIAILEDGANEEDDEDASKSFVVKVEFTETQQADIDLFKEFSTRLNRLLGYSPERGERILKLAQLINNECARPVDPVQLSAAAYMHNMGMAMILKCKDDEAAREQAERNHPLIGAQLLSKHPGWDDATAMVSAYQERFDGTGYPEGLVGPLIPQGAVILAMAVKFIDIVWGKSGDEYKKSAMRAIQKVNQQSGKRFPPHLIDSFNKGIRKVLVARSK
ncbi:HD domain-containing phosphohydrolase [Marinomonas mediterranea]|jgi:Response regulator containing a CheY-like receiver domain and an HD-GYP domain|uniref:Hpt protein n=1 Tax=Marinomonas mediterranea (strain ATCC 700492 / JCM 21426 / NBRC 103028 / MMB-1) TaxID=717774 RepID=F2K1L3_MARM1|nr:HD domain-containing phosphohydrolase [Marinomonas mediterranea]ADZ92243.1 Hpt protein [Marinomonas mediterranea MMB-1]WCN10200.1 phosphohydrolase [Marinomonas mediterranea]WCN14244.1 phosphohydrolase [Marinomonas mediterranea]WCN18301.1 phosphohydrolase [Marinomonas mediterranea MMB-1]